MEENMQNKEDRSFRLKKIQHDPIEDISADQLMENIRTSIMTKGLLLSLAFHLVFIGLLSIGFINLCVKYKSLAPRAIIKIEEAKKAEEAKQKKRKAAMQAAIEKAKQEAKTNEAAKTNKTGKITAKQEVKKKTKVMSKIEKAVTETSDERPIKSALDSLDDDLE